MYSFTKSILEQLGLKKIVVSILEMIRRVSSRVCRVLTRTDQKLFDQHRQQTGPKRLHLGCGTHRLAGWLNTDYYPRTFEVMHLNAVTRYPFPDDVFDVAFSEHMIEHVPYSAGASMISECYRVLKPGGRIRLATPDLAFLLDLFRDQPSRLQQDYLDWSTQHFIPWAPGVAPGYVVNNFVRDWGHQFIYDESTLRTSLERAGFVQVARVELNSSVEVSLQNLEFEKRMPPGFLRLESLILEAVKPG